MTYGTEDGSYQAAGELAGLTLLVDAFYAAMEALPEAAHIRAMHPRDLTLSRRKLTTFLSGWLGGPRLFNEQFGPIHIPQAHAHMPIDESERDAWMTCMRVAVAAQPWDADFQLYFLDAIAVPAERVRLASAARRAARAASDRST